jgi:hypothetical protein
MDKYRESDISIPFTMVRMRLYRIPENLGYITYGHFLGKWSGSPGQYSDIQTEREPIHGHDIPGHEIGCSTHQMAQAVHMPGPNKWVPDATVAYLDQCAVFTDSVSLVTW